MKKRILLVLGMIAVAPFAQAKSSLSSAFTKTVDSVEKAVGSFKKDISSVESSIKAFESLGDVKLPSSFALSSVFGIVGQELGHLSNVAAALTGIIGDVTGSLRDVAGVATNAGALIDTAVTTAKPYVKEGEEVVTKILGYKDDFEEVLKIVAGPVLTDAQKYLPTIEAVTKEYVPTIESVLDTIINVFDGLTSISFVKDELDKLLGGTTVSDIQSYFGDIKTIFGYVSKAQDILSKVSTELPKVQSIMQSVAKDVKSDLPKVQHLLSEIFPAVNSALGDVQKYAQEIPAEFNSIVNDISGISGKVANYVSDAESVMKGLASLTQIGGSASSVKPAPKVPATTLPALPALGSSSS